MPTVQINAQLSAEDLVQAVKQLSKTELERFVRKVSLLRARKIAPGLSAEESSLLLKINQGIPRKIQTRYHKLIEKRRAETLTAAEYDELLTLTDQVEEMDVKRLEYLGQLASIRQKPLTALMKELDIQTPAYG